MNVARDWAALIGRALLAFVFIPAGYSKIGGFAGTAGYMASKGLPAVEVLLALTIVLELGGGLPAPFLAEAHIIRVRGDSSIHQDQV